MSFFEKLRNVFSLHNDEEEPPPSVCNVGKTTLTLQDTDGRKMPLVFTGYARLTGLGTVFSVRSYDMMESYLKHSKELGAYVCSDGSVIIERKLNGMKIVHEDHNVEL